jgi:hypothetical protein
MSLSRPNLPRRANVLTVRRSLTNLFALAFSGLLACDGDSPVIPGTVEISVIEVDSGARILERGALDTLTATRRSLSSSAAACSSRSTPVSPSSLPRRSASFRIRRLSG